MQLTVCYSMLTLYSDARVSAHACAAHACTAALLAAQIKQGATHATAWNMALVEIMRASRAHCLLLVLESNSTVTPHTLKRNCGYVQPRQSVHTSLSYRLACALYAAHRALAHRQSAANRHWQTAKTMFDIHALRALWF
eukprot:8894-Heterococcus_DN1.PRE.3